MKKAAGEKQIHHGQNVRLARTWKNMTQDTLADKLGMYQTDISTLEQKETIEDKTLEKIAQAMDVPIDFFKSFDLGDNIKSYSVTNQDTYEMTQTNSDTATGNDVVQQKTVENEFSMAHGENSTGDIMEQKIIENQENIYNPLDKVTELYERLLKEKDQQIEALQSKKG